ncbi:MAG: hypothetical protein KDJ44_15285 [Rhodoblastus sp.]|nr:hypothetical protein [Rhodoblastus sp.]
MTEIKLEIDICEFSIHICRFRVSVARYAIIPDIGCAVRKLQSVASQFAILFKLTATFLSGEQRPNAWRSAPCRSPGRREEVFL